MVRRGYFAIVVKMSGSGIQNKEPGAFMAACFSLLSKQSIGEIKIILLRVQIVLSY